MIYLWGASATISAHPNTTDVDVVKVVGKEYFATASSKTQPGY